MNTQIEKDRRSIVEHKVRRRVATKVLHDIQLIVDKITSQEESENKARTIIAIVVLLLVVSGIIMTVWPSCLRLLSSLINVS